MLDQNKYTQYLKYAVGEIVLVVIGILIAFQVNEWSQNRKNTITEINMLTEIKSNVTEDSIQLKEILRKRQLTATSVARMISQMPDQSFNLDTLSIDLAHFLYFDRFFPTNNAHEMLKSSGLSLTNRLLAVKLSRYFDILQHREVLVNKDIEMAFNEFIFKNRTISKEIIAFDFEKSIKIAHPYDPIFLKELLNQLILFKDNNNGTLNYTISTLKENNQLLIDVRNELKRLQH